MTMARLRGRNRTVQDGRGQRGTALVEAAIIFPCLVLILYWSAALSDVMVLKLKSAEAARFSLWETTVFRTPADINADMKARFVDLRSPAAINTSFTGLMMYPLASNLEWSVALDTRSKKVGLGGTVRLPRTNNVIDNFINLVIGALSRSVDSAVSRERFNVHGAASARVTLLRATPDEKASSILKGRDLLGLKGDNDLDHPKSMTNFTFQTPLPSEKPMQLVFDTWKAWPKPAMYTADGAPTNTNVSPMKTYPTVEEQVSAQVGKIVFFGLTRQSWFNRVRSVGNSISGAGVTTAMAGGKLPDVFSSDRMDDRSKKGPMTILPPEKADVAWAPTQCSGGPCPTQRIGDVTSAAPAPKYLDDFSTMGDRVDRTRYTVPYRINTVYWTQSGGTDKLAENPRLATPKAKLTQQNEYVKTYQCRGHYFSGSTRAQETNANKRYKPACNR